jgi:hypothetical protein
MQTDELAGIENVVRALATASRSLRLYPPASSIPQEAVSAAEYALTDALGAEPVLALTVAREGFTWHSNVIGKHTPGASELADTLRSHGVAEVDFLPGVSGRDLLAFLTTVGTEPGVAQASGGIGALLASQSIDAVRVVDVQLTVIDNSALEPDAEEDFEDFLRRLASDPDKLAVWLAAAARRDPALLEEGLAEISRVAGEAGHERLLECLADAFKRQDTDAKDAIFGLALHEQGAVRGLASGMFRFLGSGEIAGSILEGSFGRNMLSLSNALAKLPLEQVTAQVRAEVQAMLPGTGHTTKEAAFLDHMIEVRERTEPETSLVDADSTYRAVAAAANVQDEDVARARDAVAAAGSVMNAAGVRTMLALLDQQQNFELYCSSAENLAAMVPRLIELGNLQLAAEVLGELSKREVEATGPWPELSARLRESIARAVGPRAMSTLVTAVVEDHSRTDAARQIVRYGGDAAGPPLVSEAISLKAEGLEAAEQLIGRRLVDLLNAAAPQAQWFQLGPIVTRLAREGDQRSMRTVESLLTRTDEPSRREIVTALASSGAPAALPLLAAALRDHSAEVAIVAARALGRSGVVGAAQALSTRLGEIDVDNADFLLARELIAALSRIPDPSATEALRKLGARKALIKRGHFAEVQGLVAEALANREGGR